MLNLPKARVFGASVRPQPVSRAPLPPFDRPSVDPDSGAALPVHTALNGEPQAPSVRYRRENFCGFRVPGLPPVPGGSADPSVLCGWFLDRYSDADQGRILDAYLQTGYTHWTLSWPDSRAAGRSIAQYVETAARLKAAGLWVDHHFFSKDFDPHNPDPRSVFPVLDSLLAAEVLDCGTVAWEMNAFVDPEACDDLIDPLCARAPGVPWYLHFLPHYAAWPRNTNDSPRAFWMRRYGTVTGLKYQAAPVIGVDNGTESWTAGMMQARINDVTARLCPGGIWGTPGFDVIAWELTAQGQFNRQLDEAHGDLVGYEALAAPGPMPLSGFGNGARYQDGSPI